MEFLINNPFIVFVLLIIIGFSTYMVSKIVDEIKLNSALSLKHKRMRITNVFKGVKTRIAGMTLATLVPMSIVVAFVVIGSNPTITQNNDLLSITSGSDIFSIYNDFNDKLGDSTYDGLIWRSTGMFEDFGSTLEGVDALNGAPGVYTARYAGENCSYSDNVNKMLLEMKNVPRTQRTATFKTVMTFVSEKKELISEGKVEGMIAEEGEEE